MSHRKKLRHTDYYSISTLHRMGFRKLNGQWQRRRQSDVPMLMREVIAAEVDDDIVEEVPGPSIAEPSTPGPSYGQSGSSSSAPPSVAPSGPSPISFVFTPDQLLQIKEVTKSALVEQEERIKEDLRDQLLSNRQLIYILEEKVEKIKTSISTSADGLKTEFQTIFDKIKGIGDDSDIYSNCNAELQGKIDSAASTVERLLNEFLNTQRDEMRKILEELKRLLKFDL